MKKIFVYVCIILFLLSFIFNLYQQMLIKEKNNELFIKEDTIQKLSEKTQKQKEKIEILEIKLSPNGKHQIEVETKECINGCKGTFSSICMANCSQKSVSEWDLEAKKNIEKLRKQLSKTDFVKLAEAEKHWQIYKNIQTELINKNIGSKAGLDNLVFAASDIAKISEDHARSLYSLWFFSDDKNIFTPKD